MSEDFHVNRSLGIYSALRQTSYNSPSDRLPRTHPQTDFLELAVRSFRVAVRHPALYTGDRSLNFKQADFHISNMYRW